MKKIFPFIITGLLSAGIAFGAFLLVGKKPVYIERITPKTVFTNYSPFAETSAPTVTAAPDLIQASNSSRLAVVYIEARDGSDAGYFGRRNYGGSTGSGVLISNDGYIATNHHVISDGEEIAVMLEDGREFDAKLIGSDPSTDLALLKIKGENLPYLSFGNSDSLMIGEWVLAVGNPFRLYSTVTAGIVSAKARNINILDEGGIENFIQTDAAVNPGNSGGALVNTRGQLMGINTAIMTYSGQYEGFSFAIPANLANKVLEDIRQYGSPKRGWLGVVIRPNDSRTADEAGLTEITGVVLDRINAGSAADLGGLKAGDIVLSIDGQKITSSPEFMGRIGQHHPGDILTVTYVRSGKTKDARVTLSESRNAATSDIATTKSPDIVLEEIGLSVRDLNAVELNKLPKDGVYVEVISSNSPMEKINMEEHFIITRINGNPVTDVEELKRELSKAGSHLYLQGYYENFPGDFAYSLDLK